MKKQKVYLNDCSKCGKTVESKSSRKIVCDKCKQSLSLQEAVLERERAIKRERERERRYREMQREYPSPVEYRPLNPYSRTTAATGDALTETRINEVINELSSTDENPF